MRLGTSFIAGPPTGSPSPGLVTTPTPSPPSSTSPGFSRHEARAVRCAPWVTSGSSPASLTTTASAHEPSTSQRSRWKKTRRSLPFLGSFTLTFCCGSPVMRALAAALAAAAAQVPVVQPVLNLSPLTLSMLGGMEGSRSFRLGGIDLLLAEHVGEARAVEVRARPARSESRTHEDERLPREARLPDAASELLKRTLDHELVWPARLVDDGARRIRRVAALEELLLQGARAGGGEEDRHRRPVRGEAPYVLSLWHRGAARPAGSGHRTGDLGHRELPPDGRRSGPERGDAGHDLPLESELLAELYLLHHGAVDARVAGMYAGHLQVPGRGPLVDPAHLFEGDGRGLDDLGGGARVLQNILVHEAAGPDHHISLANEPRP